MCSQPVYGVVSKSLILLLKRIYVLWICILNTDDPLTVLVIVLDLVLEPRIIVLVLEPQVVDNNTA